MTIYFTKDALSPGDQCHALGELQIASGTIRATDPCYSISSRSTHAFKAVPGTWHAQCLTGPTNWGHRVKALGIYHDSVSEDIFTDITDFKNIASVSVDSSQCGFFDDAAYPTKKREFEYKKGTFYADCCDRSDLALDQQRPGGAVIGAKFGVVSSSGYGDGRYPVLVHHNEHGQALAAILLFINDDEDEEHEEEAYNDEG